MFLCSDLKGPHLSPVLLCKHVANARLVGAIVHMCCLPPGLEMPRGGADPTAGFCGRPCPAISPSCRLTCQHRQGRRGRWAARQCCNAPTLGGCQGKGPPDTPLVPIWEMLAGGRVSLRLLAVWRKRACRTPEEVSAYTCVFFLILIVWLSEVCSVERLLPSLPGAGGAGLTSGRSGSAACLWGRPGMGSEGGCVISGQSFPTLDPVL